MLQSQIHCQQQILSAEMRQSLKILQLPMAGLQAELIQFAEENPMVDLDQFYKDWQNGDSNSLMTFCEDFSGSIFETVIPSRQAANENDSAQTADGGSIQHQETFSEYVKEQLPQILKYLPFRYAAWCEYIIDSLDHRGYLDEPLDLLASFMGSSVEEATQALYAVQSLAPTGVGARSLEECLTLQLAHSPYFNKYTLNIIQDYLPLLAKGNIEKISKDLKIPFAEAQRYCQVIQAFNPIPSNGFLQSKDLPVYIIPDAAVEIQGQEITVSYNQRALPKISPLSEYLAIMEQQKTTKLGAYLEDQNHRIIRMQQDLKRRESTLIKMIRFILDRQKEYLLGQVPAPVPLSVQEIAQELHFHQSTISRGIKDKYIFFSGHTVPLREFVSGKVGNGAPVNKRMLKICFDRIIDAEDKLHPLSDESLRRVLSSMDIEVSRRTVTEYRKEFDIPSAAYRKRKER